MADAQLDATDVPCAVKGREEVRILVAKFVAVIAQRLTQQIFGG